MSGSPKARITSNFVTLIISHFLVEKEGAIELIKLPTSSKINVQSRNCMFVGRKIWCDSSSNSLKCSRRVG